MIIAISILAYFSPFLIKDIHLDDFSLIRIVFFLIGINLILTPLFGISESVLIGTNNGYLINYIKIFWIIINAFCMYLVVTTQNGIQELAYVVIFITTLKGFHIFILFRNKIKWFGIKKPKREELGKFFSFSSWKTVWSFIAKFFMSGEIIFIGILIGASAVSKYIFTGYIAITGIAISAIITSAISPGLGKMIGNNELISASRIINQLREALLAFSLLVASASLLLNKSFVNLWVGEDLFLGDIENLLIILLMIQLIILRSEAALIDLSLNIKKKVLIGLFSLILSSIFVVIFYNYFYASPISIFIGLFAGRLIMTIIFPLYTNHFVNIKENIKNRSKSFFILIIILSLSYTIGVNQTFNSWLIFILFSLFEIIICSLIIYNLLLTDLNKNLIKNKILKRK